LFIFNQLEVLLNGTIQLREREVLILHDSSEYETGKYNRRVFTPDMDIESIDCSTCKTLAQTLWTPEVIQTYKDSLVQVDISSVKNVSS
jgi:hypothetical protein